MSLDQIGTQLFINKGVLIKALVLDQLKKDAYFDREKLALELGVDQATVKKTANRIIAARPDVFPLVTCPRCHRSVRQNEIDPTVGLVGMCSGCRIEVEMILNQMSDLNIAYTKGGNLVNHRWGGYDKWAVDPRRFDREKNTLEWESLVGKLEKEKPSETFGEYPEIEEVECIA
jgi:hypothetical protein